MEEMKLKRSKRNSEWGKKREIFKEWKNSHVFPSHVRGQMMVIMSDDVET